MFRSRAKEEKAPSLVKTPVTDSNQPRDPQAPKEGRRPSAGAAQSQRRSVANTPMTRKDAAKRQREERRTAMARQREALAKGDERYLPARDQGPVRKFARDFIDSRFNIAEYFLPMAVVILVLSMIRVASLQNVALLLWLVVIVMIVLDSIVTGFRLKKRLAERFPDERRRGAVAYALMRSSRCAGSGCPSPRSSAGSGPEHDAVRRRRGRCLVGRSRWSAGRRTAAAGGPAAGRADSRAFPGRQAAAGARRRYGPGRPVASAGAGRRTR